MSLVKIRREISKSNFYGTIWSQANEEAVKPFIANLCLGLTHFFSENVAFLNKQFSWDIVFRS
jgi:hypothetical protein